MRQSPFLFPAGSQLGADNLVLRARATHHRVDEFAGPLSIKTVIKGDVTWTVNGRSLVVDPSSFLVLAAGETYSMNIAAEKPVETCCVFFAAGFVEQVAADLTSPVENAFCLAKTPAPALTYLSALHSCRDGRTIQRARTLAVRCSQALNPSRFEQEFVDLAADLLHLYQRIRDEIGRLPAARASTRDELFRRLLIGREYFHSHASGPISLTTVSRVAGLSLFHFHRGFTQAFQVTPHSYLTRLRLARARRLLEAGSSVLDACLDVGFLSPSAFSRLFRANYGEPPSTARQKLARSGKTLS